MMKRKLITMVLIALTIATVGQVSAQIPEVTLSETTINPNDTVYIDGSGFDPNNTVRIDLYLPTGTILEGVAYNETDMNGTFEASFKAPDTPTGSGYIKIVSGNMTISKYVYFVGSTQYKLDVSIPDKIYSDNYANITLKAPFISGNHIVNVTLTQPDSSILSLFYVLHDGYSNMQMFLKWEGTYHLYLSIGGTPYNYTTDFTVVKKPTSEGQNNTTNPNPPAKNQTTENIKWMISNSLNNYIVSITIGNETVLSGNIYLYTPDGKSQSLAIEHGVAKFTADRTGIYNIQFIKDKTLYSKSISFNPSVSLKTNVDETGIMSITFTVDNEPISVSATIYEGTLKKSTIELINGVGTYTLPESGTFTIKANIFNKTAVNTVTYQESPVINQAYAYFDNGQVFIVGSVTGKYSGKPIADKAVSVEVSGIGTIYAHTDERGKFMNSIAIPSDNQGQTVYVTASVGNYQKTLSVKTEKDFWGAYGVWIVLLILVLIGIAWKKGYLGFLKKLPQGRTKKAVAGRRFQMGR